ncbi:hypothetical protein MMC30_002949 [Trapelia coarctata]|nr:hypothetical protein [Trapelia coarctata]
MDLGGGYLSEHTNRLLESEKAFGQERVQTYDFGKQLFNAEHGMKNKKEDGQRGGKDVADANSYSNGGFDMEKEEHSALFDNYTPRGTELEVPAVEDEQIVNTVHDDFSESSTAEGSFPDTAQQSMLDQEAGGAKPG